MRRNIISEFLVEWSGKMWTVVRCELVMVKVRDMFFIRLTTRNRSQYRVNKDSCAYVCVHLCIFKHSQSTSRLSDHLINWLWCSLCRRWLVTATAHPYFQTLQNTSLCLLDWALCRHGNSKVAAPMPHLPSHPHGQAGKQTELWRKYVPCCSPVFAWDQRHTGWDRRLFSNNQPPRCYTVT